MAIFRQESIIILVFIEFLQVFFLEARHTEFVYGPREHLDSGQVPAGEPFLPWTRKTFERDRQVRNYDSSEEDHNRNEDDKALFENTSFQQENENENIIGKYWIYEDTVNLENDNLYSSESIEDEKEKYIEIPLRVKRRIIPIGGSGKALDRKRNHRTGPFARSRSPWADPPQHRQGASVVRRNGPTGSSALFSLYPELAPPDWKARRGIKTKKSKAKHITETDAFRDTEEGQFKREENERTTKSERIMVPQKRHKLVPSPKRKAKLPKHLKEEIAVFAEHHGISGAVSHFSSKLNLPIKPEMVEKFLVRYQTRIQRRAGRT